MDENRKSIAEMLGEFVLETALLVLVFVPLDLLFRNPNPYPWLGILATVLLSGVLLTIGIIIERLRGE
jgi:hypothetical protein